MCMIMKSNSKFLFSVCLFLPFILSCQQKIETDNNEDTVMGQYYLDWASWYGCPVDENSTHQNPMYLMDNYRNTVDYWEPYNIIDVVKALPHSDDDNGYRESEYTINLHIPIPVFSINDKGDYYVSGIKYIPSSIITNTNPDATKYYHEGAKIYEDELLSLSVDLIDVEGFGGRNQFYVKIGCNVSSKVTGRNTGSLLTLSYRKTGSLPS